MKSEKCNAITKGEWIFIGFLVFFCLLFVFVEKNNGRFWTSDFQVYYEATRDFFAGNNPYVHNYGLDTGYFKYTPFTLYLFSPQTLFSYGTGQIIHTILLAGSLIISVMNMRKLTDRFFLAESRKVPTGMLYLLFACVAIHVTRELHLGNINLLLLLFFNLGLRSALDKKVLQLSIFWGLMIILKPIMIFVALPLMVNKQWKAIGIMAGLGIFFFLFPLVNVGLKGDLALWSDWFKAISAHGEYLTSYNAIGTLTKIHTGFTAGWIVSLLCLFTLIFLMVNEAYRLKKPANEIILVWSAVFAAFIPNFFVTDTEHFLLSAPLIWLLFSGLINKGRWYHWTGFAIGMLLFSFNSSDLLGNLTDFVYDNGLLGIGNLIFIITFLSLRYQRNTMKDSKILNTGS